MYAKVQEIFDMLTAEGQRLNPSLFATFPGDSALTTWTEGGEWPAFKEDYLLYKLPDKKYRDLASTGFFHTERVDQAMATIERSLEDESTCGISMTCGQGKSTKLIRAIHRMKFGSRTIVVEPSLVTAKGLSEYLAEEDVHYSRDSETCDLVRGIYYTGVGGFLDMILRDWLEEDDVVVLDEAHSASLVHDLVETLLGYYKCHVVLLTASTSDKVRARRGVKLVEVSSVIPRLSEDLARERANIVVGVLDNMTYASPAAPLVGATVAGLKLVYDTGLRAEPRVYKGKLVQGERKATVGEIVQMAGRLGREQTGGTVYYTLDAKPMKSKRGLPLYDVMSQAMSVVIGLEKGDREKMAGVWQINGLLKPSEGKCVAALPPEYASVDDAVATQSDAGGRGATVDRAEPVEECVIEVGSPVDQEGPWRRVFHTRASSSSSTSSSASEALSELVSRELKRGGTGITTGVVSVRQGSSSFFRKRGRLDMASCAIDFSTGQVAKVLPDAIWRPFRRLSDSGQQSLTSSKTLSNYWQTIIQSVDYGDTVFPCTIPVSDTRQVDAHTEDEARYVVSGRVLPSFSEKEVLSVISVWNRYVTSLRGRCAGSDKLAQFVCYFKQLRSYELSLLGEI